MQGFPPASTPKVHREMLYKPLSSKLGTYKTFEARFWLCLSGENIYYLSRCSCLAQKRYTLTFGIQRRGRGAGCRRRPSPARYPAHTHSLFLSHTHSLTHSLTLSLSHPHSLSRRRWSQCCPSQNLALALLYVPYSLNSGLPWQQIGSVPLLSPSGVPRP